jgi:hypothetical protein
MTDRIRFDLQDKAALRALDSDCAIDASGEVATITGSVKIEIVRVGDERYQLAIDFPGKEFVILLSRDRTLEQLGICDESVPEQ